MARTDQDIEVKPCPFCGSRIVGGKTFCSQLLGFGKDVTGGLEICCDGFGYYWVSCTQDDDLDNGRIVDCCVGPKVKGPQVARRNPDKTREASRKAIAAWNKRASAIQGRLDMKGAML